MFSSQTIPREQDFLQLASETDGRFLGPMPLDCFMDAYLSLDALEGMPSVAPDLFHRVERATAESEMYGPIVSFPSWTYFISVIERLFSGKCD
jgi:hypothetical protein